MQIKQQRAQSAAAGAAASTGFGFREIAKLAGGARTSAATTTAVLRL